MTKPLPVPEGVSMNTTDGDTMANISAEVSGRADGVGEVWVGGGAGETLIDVGVGAAAVG